MKRVIAIVFIIYSNICFSQPDTSHLLIDKYSEISISVVSPGVSLYTSEIKNHMYDNSYFNMIFLGFCFNKFSVNLLMNLKGIMPSDSFSFNNQLWQKGKELTYFSVGTNLSYSIPLSSRIHVKPFAGISTSQFYLVKQNPNDPEQQSKTSLCGQFGINAEYRFKPKRINSFTDEITGDRAWNNQYWSIQLQTGVFPSVFKKNTGLNGNLFYVAIGGSYNVGSYVHYKK